MPLDWLALSLCVDYVQKREQKVIALEDGLLDCRVFCCGPSTILKYGKFCAFVSRAIQMPRR
jgi:hypothetical protein